MMKIDTQKQVRYDAGKCLKTRLQSGNRSRHLCGFFASIVTSMDGWAKGQPAPHDSVRVFNTRPPLMLENMIGVFVNQTSGLTK